MKVVVIHMSTKITAAILRQCGDQPRPYGDTRPLDVTSIDLAPPKAGELLIKIDAAGLCHSDLSVIHGDRPRPMPMALGHEATGTILSTGTANDPDFKAGDRIVMAFLPACGSCVECASGRGYLCGAGTAANGSGTLLNGGYRLSENGCDVHHHLGVSAFASHAVIDRRSAVKIPADVPPEVAALFGCAVLTGVGAVWNTAQVRPGESVLIFGLGGVGLAALLGAVAAGAVPVLAVDPVKEKRELALELGASQAISPDELSSLPKTDVVIETVGNANVLTQAYSAAARGGRVVTVGLPNPTQQLSIPAVSLVADAKTLMGSYMGSSIPSRDIPRYIDLWRAGRLPVEKLLSSVSPLSEINELMDKLADGHVVRQLVIP